jgi:ADP-ribose pyrophosphatase YjhB (NUDIX family)
MTVAKTLHPMPFTRIELCVLSLVDERLQVLLGRRQKDPFKGQWAMPGGVLRIDQDANLEDAAQRVAKERLELALPYLHQQCAVGRPNIDDRAPWSLSIVYRAMTPSENFHPKAGKRLEELKWVAVDKAMVDATLAFDHRQIITSAVVSLRAEVDRLDIPFQLLPEWFTLGELQASCEFLLGHRLDKSSFRRRLDDKQIVSPVEGEFRRGANRPAQLYKSSLDRRSAD